MLGFVTKPAKHAFDNTVAGAIRGFWSGFWAPLRALTMILASPRLISLIAVPLAVNIGIYILFFHYGAHYLEGLIATALAHMSAALPAWLVSVSGWVLKILAWLALALIAALTFTVVGGLVSAPFNDHLSRITINQLYKKLGGPPPNLVRHPIGATIWLELKRVIVLIGGAIAALIIGLIPLLQPVALILGALLLSFEYFGYPISQHSAHLRPVARFTLRHPTVSLGFGSFLLLLMALPFASLVYIPLAVVGGTILHTEYVYETNRR